MHRRQSQMIYAITLFQDATCNESTKMKPPSLLLDNVLLTKDILRPTKKPTSVGWYKSKSEKMTSKNKARLKNKKFRSVSTQVREVSAESSSDE